MAFTKPAETINTNKSGVNFSDMSGFNDAYSVAYLNTDGTTGVGEVNYIPKWTKWHGYYRTIPEFGALIDKFASWTFGRGIIADKANEEKMRKIRGIGKDNFRTIAKNQWKVALICGDSFAEIIKDNQGRLKNLKPLNPGSIQIVFDEFGMIKRYEQISQISGFKKVIMTFEVDEIFHLIHERVADEMHGVPFGEKMENLILMLNEGMQDQGIVFHRYVKPIQIISVDTDKTSELDLVQSKFDNAYKKTENIIIPKGVIEQIERVSIPQFSTLDPLPWLKFLIRRIVTSSGMPEIIMGWGEDTTEASSKVIYLAFQQTIEDYQIYNETEYDLQLNIKFELEFPASLEADLARDQQKDGNQLKDNKFTNEPKKESE